jgi:hypothetical protein
MVKRHLAFLEKLSQATYPELFSLWLLLNVVCTVIYFGLATVHSINAPTQLADMDTASRLFNSFYFSVITATSVGYGDILPEGLSKVVAMIQSVASLLIFAIFVTKLVSRRQETTLAEVHRMTSESIFYNIRQGLFLVRKDFDMLIHEIQENGVLSEQDWEILTTAYLQAQNLIEEIPNLYNGQGHDLYIIDIKREKLLLEAMQRTMKRMEKLISILDERKVDWRAQKDSADELAEFLDIMHSAMPLWREKSPTERVGTFDDIMQIAATLQERVKRLK